MTPKGPEYTRKSETGKEEKQSKGVLSGWSLGPILLALSKGPGKRHLELVPLGVSHWSRAAPGNETPWQVCIARVSEWLNGLRHTPHGARSERDGEVCDTAEGGAVRVPLHRADDLLADQDSSQPCLMPPDTSHINSWHKKVGRGAVGHEVSLTRPLPEHCLLQSSLPKPSILPTISLILLGKQSQ